MNIRPYSLVLRDLNFLKSYDSRAGGCRVVCFENTYGNRKVEVQLWDDGKHRASHFLNGRMSTKPTYFTDVFGMRDAINREITRADHQATTTKPRASDPNPGTEQVNKP